MQLIYSLSSYGPNTSREIKTFEFILYFFATKGVLVLLWHSSRLDSILQKIYSGDRNQSQNKSPHREDIHGV